MLDTYRMKLPTIGMLWVSGCLLGGSLSLEGGTVQFAGYDWTVKSGTGGPGPNIWDERNVWVDDQGWLHLKIARRDDRWSCAEVVMQQRLGFGAYDFEIGGRLDLLDDYVVLGLFNYPPSDVGPDGTHEIDIEFARWGQSGNPAGNYVVWPAQAGLRQQSETFAFTQRQELTRHRFLWSRTRVVFGSWGGQTTQPSEQLGSWTFSPSAPAESISTQAMPVHMNLWLFQGRPPKNGQEVEIVIRAFRFTGAPLPPSGFRKQSDVTGRGQHEGRAAAIDVDLAQFRHSPPRIGHP